MSGHPTEDIVSPLDEVLESVPTEQPPADLEKRCLNALAKAGLGRLKARRPVWFVVLRTAAAAAVVFFLLVSAATLKWGRFGARERPSVSMARAPEPAAEFAERGISAMKMKAAPAPSAKAARVAPERVAEKRLAPAEEAEETAVAPPAPYPLDLDVYGRGVDELEVPSRPWYDVSGERKKVITKAMELEVEEVEEAYDRAVSIIEKSEGFVVSEDIRLTKSGRDQAHLIARVPVEQMNGVVAQLRELGRTVKLVGESQDKTKDYYKRGRDIRALGATEEELVQQYERETNPQRKRELYRQIMGLRGENQRQKEGMLDLDERIEFALLDVTLIEEAGPREFFSEVLENTAKVGAWLGATAVFWLPVAVIIWLLVKRRKPAEEEKSA